MRETDLIAARPANEGVYRLLFTWDCIVLFDII